MYPQLNIYLDDATEPLTAETTSMDFWVYEELVDKARAKTSEHGMRLAIAYIHATGTEPKSLDEVKAWARERKARVTIGDDARPTPPAPTAGSSSS